jgi:hypothetical protein
MASKLVVNKGMQVCQWIPPQYISFAPSNNASMLFHAYFKIWNLKSTFKLVLACLNNIPFQKIGSKSLHTTLHSKSLHTHILCLLFQDFNPMPSSLSPMHRLNYSG